VTAPAHALPVSAAGVRVVPGTEWDDVLAGVGGLDCYTRTAYHQASARLEPFGTVPVLLHHTHTGGEMALPLLLRPLAQDDGWDATSAYGYGGPVATPGSSPATLGRALHGWAQANGVVATFLRLHPVLANDRWVPPDAELVALGATVAWDLTPSTDLTARMHGHHRRLVRKAHRAGLEVAVNPAPPSLARFRSLYEVTMRRRRASAYYFFPPAYWEALTAHRAALGLVLVEGRLQDELVAALLCLSDGSTLHYHLGASTDAGLPRRGRVGAGRRDDPLSPGRRIGG
jgi:serine/alanine adding enzyme